MMLIPTVASPFTICISRMNSPDDAHPPTLHPCQSCGGSGSSAEPGSVACREVRPAEWSRQLLPFFGVFRVSYTQKSKSKRARNAAVSFVGRRSGSIWRRFGRPLPSGGQCQGGGCLKCVASPPILLILRVELVHENRCNTLN